MTCSPGFVYMGAMPTSSYAAIFTSTSPSPELLTWVFVLFPLLLRMGCVAPFLPGQVIHHNRHTIHRSSSLLNSPPLNNHFVSIPPQRRPDHEVGAPQLKRRFGRFRQLSQLRKPTTHGHSVGVSGFSIENPTAVARCVWRRVHCGYVPSRIVSVLVCAPVGSCPTHRHARA